MDHQFQQVTVNGEPRVQCSCGWQGAMGEMIAHRQETVLAALKAAPAASIRILHEQPRQ
jgi:hypothetical protein